MKFRDAKTLRRGAILLLSLTFATGCSERKDSGEKHRFRGGSETSSRTARAACSAGDISIIDMYLPPADNGATGAVFCTVANGGEQADSLLGAVTPVTPDVEIHEMVEDGGMMTMRLLQGGLAVPAKGSVDMKPGGAHIMLINVMRALKIGDTVDVELRFARAGTVTCRGIVGNGPPKPEAEAQDDNTAGAEVYRNYCRTCHQQDGTGIGDVFPPLAGSDFLKDKDRTIDAVVNGLQGTVSVNGKEYDGVMPPLLSVYDNEQAAAVINYVVRKFGDGSWKATTADVQRIRKE